MSSDQKNYGFKEVFSLMLKYKTGIILVITLNVLWSLFQLCFPFLTRSLVDSGIQYSDMEVVMIILVSQLLLFLGISVSDVLRKWILRHIGVRISLIIILDYLKVILRKPLSFFNVEEQGRTIQQYNDNLRVEAFMTTDTSSFIESILKIFMFGVLLFIFDVKVGLILVGSVILLALWVKIFLKARAALDEERFKMSSTIRSEIIDIYRGIVDLKSNNQENKRLDNWHSVQGLYSNARLNMLRISMMINVGIEGFAQLRDILILFLAAKATIEGTMTLGTLLAIQYILGQLAMPIDKVMQYISKYQDTRLSLQRINKVFAIKNEERYDQHGLPPAQNTISVNNLSFRYKEDLEVIKDVSFDIPFGKKVAIIGESGSGKSTMMKLLVGLLSYEKGGINVGPLELSKINLNEWLKSCTIVLQESILFSRSLWYNITFEDVIDPLEVERVNECLELCLIRNVVERNAKGLNSIVGKDVDLSKGQVQRILLARALYKNSDYFLLDEPFSALDGPTYRKILNNLKTILADKTFVIITHKLGVAQKMDYIYMMDDGQIIEQGTHGELMELQNKYASLFNDEV